MFKSLGHTWLVASPPQEYRDVFEDNDSGKLVDGQTSMSHTRNPVAAYGYDKKFSIVETKIELSEGGSLNNILKESYGRVDRTNMVIYSIYNHGNIELSVKDPGPVAGATAIYLKFDGDTIGNVRRDDSVVSYFFKRNQFSISYHPDSVADIVAKDRDRSVFAKALPESRALLLRKKGKSVFVLLAVAIDGKADLPEDLLYDLVIRKR